MSYSIVVPTIGRPSLTELLASLVEALASGGAASPDRLIIVDDRPAPEGPLPLLDTGVDTEVIQSGPAAGPAAARNVGWRMATTEWVAFLDDDVRVTGTWAADLAGDLDSLDSDVAGSQGRITVPLSPGRPPTDWERSVAGLETAMWATADMAYRLDVLEEVGGFDERFPRAYREDADLGLRITSAGYRIVCGSRTVLHPVPPVGRWVSIRKQAGNADDVLMRALHGPDWRARSQAGRGRTKRHVATAAAGLLGAGAAALSAARLVSGKHPLRARFGAWGGIAATGWALGTGEFAARRLPRDPLSRPAEAVTMLATSAAIPVSASFHCARAISRLPSLVSRPRTPADELRLGRHPMLERALYGPVPRPVTDSGWRPSGVLLDRDGTINVDSGYPGDPDAVRLMPGARQAVRRLREAGLRVGVVTNQSGIARGILDVRQVDQVNARIDSLLGGLDAWAVCPHGPDDGCACRKPGPGLIKQAASELEIDPSECAVIGDIGADVDAATAAGARGVLVPTRRTRAAEIRRAPQVAASLLQAVGLVLEGRC
jgi:histidinol-phosphate phosphatase family protein